MAATGFKHTAPAEPLAPWFGGKRYLARRIIARIEAIPHRCYAEPFVGMGGVFLRRQHKPAAEVVNYANGEVVNLFRIVREHPEALAHQFRFTLASRAEFKRLVETAPATLTDIQRAARFAYLQRLAFGGKPATEVTPGQLGMSASHAARMRRLIEAAHRRLEGVQVECLDWAAFIARYDRPFTLFYLDPPYWGHARDYGKNIFTRADFTRLAAVLSGIKGRFILSLNDRPEVRRLFGGFAIESVTTRYSFSVKATRRAQELLITND